MVFSTSQSYLLWALLMDCMGQLLPNEECGAGIWGWNLGLEFRTGTQHSSQQLPSQTLFLSTASHEALPTEGDSASKISIPLQSGQGKAHQGIPAQRREEARPGSPWRIFHHPLCLSPIILGNRNNSFCVGGEDQWDEIKLSGFQPQSFNARVQIAYQLLLLS